MSKDNFPHVTDIELVRLQTSAVEAEIALKVIQILCTIAVFAVLNFKEII